MGLGEDSRVRLNQTFELAGDVIDGQRALRAGIDELMKLQETTAAQGQVSTYPRPDWSTPSGEEQQVIEQGPQTPGGSSSGLSNESRRGGRGPNRWSRRGSSHAGYHGVLPSDWIAVLKLHD